MRPEPALSLRHAVALGALHGPAELLPVSSSAHVALVPRLLGWPYPGLPADARKSFEVALHAGTLGALLRLVPPLPAPLALISTLPPAAAGWALERPIEQRLGGVRATAAGLLAGAALLVVADAAARGERPAADAGAADALALGLGQAAALSPGLSRLGMAVAVARLRGFSRPAAFELGRSAGLPIIAGATVLKGVRAARGGLAPELRAPFAAGAAAALLSTLAAAPLARRAPLRAAAAERALLAVAALRQNGRR
jgi:undecaprenyl-diphosphatase